MPVHVDLGLANELDDSEGSTGLACTRRKPPPTHRGSEGGAAGAAPPKTHAAILLLGENHQANNIQGISKLGAWRLLAYWEGVHE
jgi:hypothetical protein